MMKLTTKVWWLSSITADAQHPDDIPNELAASGNNNLSGSSVVASVVPLVQLSIKDENKEFTEADNHHWTIRRTDVTNRFSDCQVGQPAIKVI